MRSEKLSEERSEELRLLLVATVVDSASYCESRSAP